jgi:hypothetical protein
VREDIGVTSASPPVDEAGVAASPSMEEWLELPRQRGNPNCSNPDCGDYPYYGVAPHKCFYKRGPEFRIGQSIGLPQATWPANFVLDLEPGEDPETVVYPNACGVYHCPTCFAGMPAPSQNMGSGTERSEREASTKGQPQ